MTSLRQTALYLHVTLSLPETCSVVVAFESVDEILWCDHSNETFLAALLHGTIWFSILYKIKFGEWTALKNDHQWPSGSGPIVHIRYIKIHLETIDITLRLYGVNCTNPYIVPPKSHSDIYCFKLNFNISKVGYSVTKLSRGVTTPRKACFWRKTKLFQKSKDCADFAGSWESLKI